MKLKTNDLMKLGWTVVIALLMVLPVDCPAEQTAEEASAEQQLVEEKLTEDAEQLVLAVNGLCCRTCGIGIGKKVCQLDFVDTESLPKGVSVDRKNSLLTVAVKEGEAIDTDSLIKAIREAGYDPVRLYQRDEDGQLQVTDVSQDS